jgi:small-conductance mechanosensitive channel
MITDARPHLRVLPRFEAAHGIDPARVTYTLLRIVGPQFLRDPESQMFFAVMNGSSTQLTLAVRVLQRGDAASAEAKMRKEIYRAFLNEGNSVPLPQGVDDLTVES